MRERFLNWVSGINALQTIAVLMVCLLVAGAFALGMVVARARQPLPPPPLQSLPEPDARAPQRGAYGAIDRIEGNVIRLRDPRNGRVWSVRAGNETVIEFGARQRIPLQALRPGLRVFVVGAPQANGFDASFIGVVMGQGQRFLMPARPGICEDCID
jgi:hypothetical protein